MKRVRVIPLIMIENGRAVVTRHFKSPVYVGDPINAIRIFNDKEVDELFIVDITKHPKKSRPDFDLISKMASESFMPLAYGGHLRSMEHAETIVKSGVEKISFNTALFSNPEMIRELSGRYGKQSIIASIDYKKNWAGQEVIRTSHNTRSVAGAFERQLRYVLELGVGEVFLNAIQHDGTLKGYDLKMIHFVSKILNIPVVACGGAASIEDFRKAIEHGASAVAAGAMFFFKGGMDAVLINYPGQDKLTSELYGLLD
ncbi:MAG: HisA/HisF-related TIM barrel protein [Chryseosolibacter sp.]